MKPKSKQYQVAVQRRADLVAEGKKIFELAEAEDRELTAEEQARDDAINAELAELDTTLARHAARMERERTMAGAPVVLKIPRGDTWGGAFSHWIRKGDKSGLEAEAFAPIEGDESGVEGYTIRAASNATDMNIGTAADGGNAVQTGFYDQIIARRDETRLSARLPVRLIPGLGTTVDVPIDNEADGEFVATNEAADFDLDAPALDKKQMTLVMYTKYTDVSYQLLNDTPTRLLEFIADFVGRGMAKTHNSLLLTEVAASGTALKTFAAAAAIAAGEPEGVVANNDLAEYMDDDASIAWVMRNSTHWAIKALTGNPRLYGSDQGADGRELLGYPVYRSQKAAAPAASAKSVYFGNWYYVGYRESPEITFLRDPYTVSIKGQVRLLWHFRTVYKVLQAEAIGYGVHPSA